MKLFKIESHPYDVGYMRNMKRTGEIKTKINYINVDKIESITEWKGTNLHAGKIGTKIIMSNTNSWFVDARCVEVLKIELENHSKVK